MCPFTSSLGVSALSTMNNCVAYPTGLLANAYTTQTAGTSTTLVTTITRNITLNLTDGLHFTDHTAVNRDVQIPAHAFYSGPGYATAITTLTSPFNLICTYNATTQLFTFTDRTSSTIFPILSTSTCLLNLGFGTVQNWESVVTPGCIL